MQTTAGNRAKSFQQRYLSSWQTNKFYVLGLFFFFLRKRNPTQLTKNKHPCCAISWRLGLGGSPAPCPYSPDPSPQPMLHLHLLGLGTTLHSSRGWGKLRLDTEHIRAINAAQLWASRSVYSTASVLGSGSREGQKESRTLRVKEWGCPLRSS